MPPVVGGGGAKVSSVGASVGGGVVKLHSVVARAGPNLSK